MPANDGYRLHDHQHIAPLGKNRNSSTQSRQSVGRSDARREFLFIVVLMPKNNELKLEGCTPTQAVAECREKEKEGDRGPGLRGDEPALFL